MQSATFPPPSTRPALDYAPGSAERAELEAALADLGSQRLDLPHTIAGKRGHGRRQEDRRAPAARPPQGARHHAQRDRRRRAARGRRGQGRGPGLARRCPSTTAPRSCSRRPSCSSGPWRADAQRRNHARPVQDRLPGRDRRRLRAHRLLALQRRTSPGRSSSEQPPLNAKGIWNRIGPPPARGLRLRDHAVQLHRDRRQPAHSSGADGQHRGLEALADAAARRALHDAAARGGRACRPA